MHYVFIVLYMMDVPVHYTQMAPISNMSTNE